MPKLLRVILAVAMWLAIGAALTIAISWAIAAWMPVHARSLTAHYNPLRSFRQPSTMIMVLKGRTWARRTWDGSNQPGDAEVRIDDAPIGWPAWGSAESARSQSPLGIDHCEHATGWPIVALWYARTYRYATTSPARFASPPATPELDGGIPLPTAPRALSLGTTSTHARALPLHPIVIGMLVDSAFWGTTSWLLLLLATRIRRGLRLRRNRCPRCAYDLNNQPVPGCPECGWNRPEQPAPTSNAPQPSPSSP